MRLKWIDMPELEIGDVILVKSRGSLVGFLIRVFETAPKEQPTTFNHVATYIGTGEIVEALPGGTVINDLLRRYGNTRWFMFVVARRIGLIDETRAVLKTVAVGDVGKPYGFLKVVAHGTDYLLSRAWHKLSGKTDEIYAARWLCRIDNYPMCSYGVGRYFKSVGLPFYVPVPLLTPDDIADEIYTSAGRWQIAYPTEG